MTEEIVLKLASEAKRITGADYLCMAGGVALNCVANGKLDSAGIFKQIFVQPAAGDAGGAVQETQNFLGGVTRYLPSAPLPQPGPIVDEYRLPQMPSTGF